MVGHSGKGKRGYFSVTMEKFIENMKCKRPIVPTYLLPLFRLPSPSKLPSRIIPHLSFHDITPPLTHIPDVKAWNESRITVAKGWFSDTVPKCPVKKIAFLRLDGDMYVSTKGR